MKNNHLGRRRSGALLITAGVTFLIAGLCLMIYNAWDSFRASAAAQGVVVQLQAITIQNTGRQPARPEELPEIVTPEAPEAPREEPLYVTYPEKEMPLAQVEGRDCLGLLELPDLGLILPVLDASDEQSLKSAPGRYAGSAYLGDLVIAGHNYTGHFGRLRRLSMGARVVFTDLEGNRFVYETADLETLAPTDIEAMTTGDWDLTLFTCTYGNRQRLALRCYRVEE